MIGLQRTQSNDKIDPIKSGGYVLVLGSLAHNLEGQAVVFKVTRKSWVSNAG